MPSSRLMPLLEAFERLGDVWGDAEESAELSRI